MLLYNAGIFLLEEGIRISGLWSHKNRLWSEGRKGLTDRMKAAVGADERVIWFHAASVGEFEQGRPLIEAFRAARPEFKIVLTFYSPSGYELRKGWKGADYVFYFPSDRPRKVRAFLDAIHPETAVIIKYEFWLNTLRELSRRGVRTFIVSSIFRRDSVFFKPWGRAWRDALGSFETIFVQNQQSLDLLAGIGVDNVIVAGDTRFDRVHRIVTSQTSIPLVEKFCGSDRVFVAGSTWGADEELLIRLINDHPDVKFIVAPHEMSEERISRLIASAERRSCRYSKPETVSEDCQLMVLDTVGLLSEVYRYASWAYVGGGFGAGIHNTVEPASYGIPVAFGPRYHKFDEAVAMVRLGAAASVSSCEELEEWFLPLKNDEDKRLKVCSAARDYTVSQLGATEKIMGRLI